MSKFKVLAVLFAAVTMVMAGTAFAVAIDDNITPQTCERSNPQCASFLETTSQGQIKWGGLVAGGLRSLTNLFVDGRLGVGTLRPSTGQQRLIADIEGAVGAKFYCDENGNNCVPGSQLGTSNGSTTVISSSVTAGNGITVNQSGNVFNVSIDPTKTQVRVGQSCAAGEAIRTVNQDGTVVCQAVGTGTGAVTTITSGPSIVVNRATGTNNYVLTVNPDIVQFRITNTCPVGQAIRGVAANGTLTCQPVTGGVTVTGDSLWATTTANPTDIYNRTLGRVSIGTTVPGLAELSVKQRPENLTTGNYSVAEFKNANNSSQIFIGRNGTGVESFESLPDTSAIYGAVTGARSTGVAGVSLGSGETYGAKFASYKVGTFSKGNVGLYATDMNHAYTQSMEMRDNRIPAALSASSKQWAGYFDGDVNVNGNTNITGTLTVNGQVIGGNNPGGDQFWQLNDGVLSNRVGNSFVLRDWSTTNAYLTLTGKNGGVHASLSGGDNGLTVNGDRIVFRTLPGYNVAMTIDPQGNVTIEKDLTVKGTIRQNGQTISDIAKNTYKIGEHCGVFTSGDQVGTINIGCDGQTIYRGGDMTKRSNFACPAKFVLAGGDFQSPGNRYFYTCVRATN